MNLKRLEEAKACYLKVIDMGDEYSEAQYCMGEVLAKLT
jgi:hypothetical protein